MDVVTIHCNHCGAPLDVSGDTRYVTCAHCGSSLEVKRGDGSIYTELLTEIGERTAVIEEQTTRIQDRLDDLSLRSELSELDQAWERDREQYMVTDEHGGRQKPSGPATMIGLVVMVIGGLFMLVMVLNVTGDMSDARSSMGSSFAPRAITLPDGTTVRSGETVRLQDGTSLTYDGGSGFGSFGSMTTLAPVFVVLVIGAAAIMLLHRFRQADEYEQAEQEYLARREELLSQLNDD